MTHTTRKGLLMWIADMTDDHLINTITMIIRNQRTSHKILMEYVDEAARRKIISPADYNIYSQYEVYEDIVDYDIADYGIVDYGIVDYAAYDPNWD